MTTWPETFQNLLIKFIDFLPALITALVVFFASLYLAGVSSNVVSRALKRREADPEIVSLGSKITRWAVIILGILVALQQINFNVTAFLAGLGIVGFTVGFALQDVSKNLVAGVLLLIQQPFDIGDSINVAGFSGYVIAIDLRATEIHTYDGQVVFIPNGEVFTNPITNITRASKRRVEVSAGVAYESDPDMVRKVALEAMASIPGLLVDPAPFVRFQSFGGSTFDLAVFYWIDTGQTDPVAAKDAGLVALKNAFTKAGINMPYPTQSLLLKQYSAS